MRFEPNHREAIEGIQAFYSNRIATNQAALQSYGQLLIRSLITLNAGAAIAYPTVAELLLKEVSIEAVMLPVCLTVVGVLAGLLCGWAAYFNHGFNSHFFESSMEEAILKADEHFDDETYYRFLSWRSETKEWYEDYKKKTEKRSIITYWLANLCGIFSAISFISSLLIFGFSVS